MSMRSLNRWVLSWCGVALVALVANQADVSAAPKDAEKPAAEKKERTANKPVVEEKERAPRMPAHFNKVVTDEQREKVLEVVQQYAPQIEQKRAELQALTQERNAALMKLLTPAQRKQVEELRAESQAKRAASLAAGGDGVGTAPAAPK